MKKFAMTMLTLAACGLFAAEIPLQNPEFNVVNGQIPGWRPIDVKDTSGSISSEPYAGNDAATAKRALKISSTQGTKYFGALQGGFDLRKFPRPGAGEALRVTLVFRQKNENVADGGFVNFSFYSKQGYLIGRDSVKRSGTFDWGDAEASVTFPEWPKDAAFFAVRLFLGKSTGSVWFAEPKLYVDVVKKN